MTGSTTLNFSKAVEEFYRDFPGAKGVFVDTDAKTCYEGGCVYPADELKIAYGGSEFTFWQVERVRQPGPAVLFADKSRPLLIYSGIKNSTLYCPLSFEKYGVDREPVERYCLDHEIAHFLKPHEFKAESKIPLFSLARSIRQEAEADAYAILRHYQRHGLDSPLPEYILMDRMENFIYNDEHFTVPVLRALIDQRHHLPIMTMTPRETLQLAEKLAKEHSPGIWSVIRLNLKLASAYRKGPLSDFFQRILDFRHRKMFELGLLYIYGNRTNQVLRCGPGAEFWRAAEEKYRTFLSQKLESKFNFFARRGNGTGWTHPETILQLIQQQQIASKKMP